ncbi:MAG: hypothetical protein M3256_14610 [Actinomycetota bacterium]|nr:hypothetical protein [Actinomycetota bacterium]
MQRSLRLSDTEVSLLVAISVLLGSVLRVPIGALTDRFGARTVFPALLLFTALPLSLTRLLGYAIALRH